MTLTPKTFPQFSLLPLELRLKIWHLALPPRIIILPRLSYKPLRPNHSQPPTPRNPYEKREWLARNQPTYHGLPISPLEYATTRYHIPSILTTNRDAYTAIRPLYRRMFNWRSYETDYWDNEGQVWFNPEIDILALGMQLPEVLGWSCVFRYREDLARVRFLALYDIVGERNGESRNIDSQEEIEELMRGLPSTVIQLASLCVSMEKFYWVVEEEEEGGERTFREELTLRRGEVYVRRSFDFLRMRRPESVIHTQDSTGPLQPEKIRTALDLKEKREKLRVERERWQRTICLRSTRELKIERDMYKLPSAVPFIVDDYTEAALDRQVKIFRNMVGYRYVPWRWCRVNSNVQPWGRYPHYDDCTSYISGWSPPKANTSWQYQYTSISSSRTILPYCTCTQCWSTPEKKDLWISCNYGRTIWFSRATPILTCSSLALEISYLFSLIFGFVWILVWIAVLKI